ncbi:hypothetical protein CRG98_046673 [Punica granatum]|uniref:Glycoside hydrolase family 3 C-terminal domain-containing protein n=1 Tax=Punica granatum TaxID=22663 RepID=A0A2I0HNW1_PUNGR|nr:hypothetical protein CRG98_046673 [Punica granatum]
MVNEIQKGALSTRLGIPMIYGIDAVHGHNNVYNATIFPHNVGLGATRKNVAACAKHYVGDGGTTNGINENNTVTDWHGLLSIHMPGYYNSIIKGVSTVMPYVSSIDALVAAWLPGTEGQGVADVLFGDYGFTGKLPRTWFKTVDQLPMNVGDAHYDPLFPFSFGLTTKPTNSN